VTPSSPRKVLLLGSGAREHALSRRIARCEGVLAVWVAPGNGGTERPFGPAHAPVRRAKLSAKAPEIVDFCRENAVDLVVVGPELPLVEGLVDTLGAAGLVVFGPSRAHFAARHGIPTAPFDVVTRFEDAERVIRARGAPIVVKADGLCAGKGVVVVASTAEEARAAARAMLEDRVFGEAGAVVVLEEKIVGREVSVLAICDGERTFVLPPGA
jgi:phosphoribosylamine--glycine ligase